MSRPSITLDLKGHLHDYMIHEFGTDPAGGIPINERHPIGMMINSMWSVSPLPKPPRARQNPVTIFLPITEKTHYIFESSFVYVPVWKEAQIEKYLEAEYQRAVRDFFCVGYELGFQQKTIIEAFLKEYGTKNNADNFERIKKMDYRRREKFKSTISTAIQSAII